MSLKFCSFASGSSGNSYLIKNENEAILIDAGISGKRIMEGLEATGTRAEDVKAILVTHEHIDHVRSLPVMTKKIPDVRIYANEDTWSAIERPVPEENRRIFRTGEGFYLAGMSIRSFTVPHDAADPVGFSVSDDERKISIVTDAGYITDEIHEEIVDADMLLLEANHEKEMLLMGSYPYPLKQRILGDEGHLSNISAGEALCRIIGEIDKRRRILLGHLSGENNDPHVALLTVENTLMEQEIYTGGDLKISVASRQEMSPLFEI